MITGTDPVRFGFTDDVLVVTGAASGIGRALTLRGLECGLRVSGWDADEPGVRETARLSGRGEDRLLTLPVNVTDRGAVRAAMATTVDRFGPVRCLANNAGPASGNASIEFDDAVGAALGSVRAVTNAWASDGNRADGAAMVVTASVAGNSIGTAVDWYAAAKAALTGYVRHLAAWRSDEFRSNAVGPGMTATPRLAEFASSEHGQRALARIPLRRMAEPDEIAWAILFLLSPLASYVNGAFLPVDGGWTVAPA